MSRNPLLKGLKPMHPGEMLREDVLPSLGKSKSEIASLLGVSRPTLYDVLNEERPVTPNLALRLARLVGGSPETWLRLQDAYDLVQMQEAISRELATIPRLEPVE
ncbi:MAG TPA: HigA family addiction module antitoxin [Rhizomicrobium sp.]|jgi:addiction module HigA family antidote